MSVTCLIPGPTKELLRRSAGVRWCFGCRAHLEHTDIVVCDEGPSYYDPIALRRCSRCNRDCTQFPRGEWP